MISEWLERRKQRKLQLENAIAEFDRCEERWNEACRRWNQAHALGDLEAREKAYRDECYWWNQEMFWYKKTKEFS